MSSLNVPHKRLLTHLTLLLHVAIALIVLLTSYLPSFDASASVVLEEAWSRPLFRWDVFHYAHIAKDGYVYEHKYAFLLGTPVIMRYGGKLLRVLGIFSMGNLTAELVAGMLASAVVGVQSVHALYDLTMHHFASPNMALLVSLLSLLSSSPATLRLASYAEPSFTYLSYKGMVVRS